MQDTEPGIGPFRPKLFTTLYGYRRATFVGDLMAGLTVAIVAIPLAMAIAIASGAEPAAGLVTAIVAGFLISALGGSRVQIGGPTGAFIVVVYSVIQTHGYDGLLTATFMAGLILIVAGFLRAGRLIRHVPDAVIHGFTVGIAIIIAASQLADFSGIPAAGLPAEFVPKLAALAERAGGFSPTTLAVALFTLALIVLLRLRLPRLPAFLIAVISASALCALAGLDVETIGSRFGALSAAIALPALPELSVERFVQLLPAAITIAFLAGIESLLSAVVADRMTGFSHRSDTEIIAQGVANLASSLVGGLPATGAIARTATNVRAGGETPVAGMAHALFILVFLVAAAPLASYLALPALAAVLMVSAWSMAEPHALAGKLRHSQSEAALLVLTLVLTVFVDLTVAVGVGILAGLLHKRFRRG